MHPQPRHPHPSNQLRVLLAFLAFDEISVLPKDSVLAVLDEAAADPDEVRTSRGRPRPPM